MDRNRSGSVLRPCEMMAQSRGYRDNFWAEVLRSSLPDRLLLHETARMLTDPSVEKGDCLEVGSGNPVLSQQIRRCGGKWQTLILDAALAPHFAECFGDTVCVLSGQAFPFRKDAFDTVVVLSGLETAVSDEAFIQECHRVLKPDGRLIVNAASGKAMSPIRVMERFAGRRGEPVAPGRRYSESQLFELLKNGFDVSAVRSYLRFFTRAAEIACRAAVNARGGALSAENPQTLRVMRTFRPVYWLAFQIDVLFFFTRGHRLAALAKRRAWRPRQAPVLVDGRSISEAVLSRISR